MKKLSALLALTVMTTFALGCTEQGESPLTSPESALVAAEGVGTPADAASAASLAGPSMSVASATSASNGGPDVGVLAYCTDLGATVFGAQNTANTLIADGRFGSATVIDGDVVQPSAQDLLDQFQCVIAMTDNRCGFGGTASGPLAGFANGGGGVVLATFGYSTSIGFTAPIFAAGLSPFQQVTGGNAPPGAINVAGASTTPPCDQLMAGVSSPVSSQFANFVSLSGGATLCTSYSNGRNLLAINATGNVVGLNTFPASQFDNLFQTGAASYRRLVSNAVFAVCGPLQVEIDIKPGSDPNSLNCNNENVSIAVAILTTDDFDATTVDHTKVSFEGASETHVDKKNNNVARRHEEDVDGDGDTDLVLHFRLGETGLTCDSEEGTLTGETFDGKAIEGADAVRMIDEGGGRP